MFQTLPLFTIINVFCFLKFIARNRKRTALFFGPWLHQILFSHRKHPILSMIEALNHFPTFILQNQKKYNGLFVGHFSFSTQLAVWGSSHLPWFWPSPLSLGDQVEPLCTTAPWPATRAPCGPWWTWRTFAAPNCARGPKKLRDLDIEKLLKVENLRNSLGDLLLDMILDLFLEDLIFQTSFEFWIKLNSSLWIAGCWVSLVSRPTREFQIDNSNKIRMIKKSDPCSAFLV